MAIKIRDLSVLAYTNGFTLWHYKSHVDTVDTIQEPGYFLDVFDIIKEGDMIMVTAVNGSCILAISSNATTMKVS